jgi:hypothetical protein
VFEWGFGREGCEKGDLLGFGIAFFGFSVGNGRQNMKEQKKKRGGQRRDEEERIIAHAQLRSWSVAKTES